ncbi:DNA mismatch repair protein [Piromyces finnis]|uniref:DNA mismatch repair protein MSH2 n=1 Tax=Piromyces finnis TaxID=1754191 RepID=A0A1Y1VLN6_9FUNG|nr:DNA mismatch repair protein [Piromyces finnis]|eukprot:ORX58397.1 DNA mismatch repair protein [Piromyces finnis]
MSEEKDIIDNTSYNGGFLTRYKQITSTKEDDCIQFFERNNGSSVFYCLYGDDALNAAHDVFKTTTVLKYICGNAKTGIPSCVISKINAMNYMKDSLLNKQKKIEIYSTSKNSPNNWTLSKKASPGNLQNFEEEIFGTTDFSVSPVICAIRVESNNNETKIGVSYADATFRKMGMTEFLDNDIYSNFESFCIQINAKECLMIDDPLNYELKKIRDVLTRCGIAITLVKKQKFNTKSIEQDLNFLTNNENIASLSEFEKKLALSSCACLIDYLKLVEDDSNMGMYAIESHELSQYMRLDASAVRALNLIETSEDHNKTMCLSGLLNNCKTTQGARLLKTFLKQPLKDINEIEMRYNIVEELIENTELRQSLQEEHLKKMPDFKRIGKKFQRNTASLQDVVRIYQVIQDLPLLKTSLESDDGKYKSIIEERFIQPINEIIIDLEKFSELVESTIDLEATEDHEYLIKAEFDEDLLKLREEMKSLLVEINEESEKAADDLGLELNKKLKLENNSMYGYHFRIPRANQRCLNKKSHYMELSTQKAGVLFTSSRLNIMNEQYKNKLEEYTKNSSALAKEIINIAGTYCKALETLDDIISHIDVFTSFAHISVNAPIPYIRPTISNDRSFKLVNARHPCLEVQDDVNFISNDVDMNRESRMFQIITGPNMGGKSTYIRQIGVIALMAQIGCFVPCDEAKICIFDSILARIGAGDCQYKGVSTFMAEMLETASILKSATENSLIIIDELGRGTSTYDGFGLAWAISEYIAKKIKCYCLFATHFHELTLLQDQLPYVTNLHVDAYTTDTSITLLYKVVEGTCDQSFGIHVAELADFPKDVIKLSKRKASELEDFSNGNDGDKTSQVKRKKPSNCSKEEIDQGNRVISEYLHDFSKIPNLKKMNKDEIGIALAQLNIKYSNQINDNYFLQEIVDTL